MSQITIENDMTAGVENEIQLLAILAEEQPEGGFTITVPNMPELITEADNEEDIYDQYIDAYRELYRSYMQTGDAFPYSLGSVRIEIKIIYLE